MEISGLLKLLIWLQVSDIFNEKKVKKSGNAEISIEKIINSYQWIGRIPLKVYEQMELQAVLNDEKSLETLEYMKKAYHSISKFLILSSISYNQYPHLIFKDVAEEFDRLTENLNHSIYSIYKTEELGMSYITDTKQGKLIPERLETITLNLKKSVIDIINMIADEIYEFDEHGVCRRKKEISKDNALQERYQEILDKHMNEDAEMTEEELDFNGGIEKIHQEIDEFMNDYFKSRHPIKYRRIPFDANEIDDKLRHPVQNYIMRYCSMYLFCSGKIRMCQWKYAEPPEKCYDVILKERELLCSYQYKGFKFSKYLSKIEKESRIVVDNVGNLGKKREILDIVDKYVDAYINYVNVHAEVETIRFERLLDSLQNIDYK